MLRAFAALHRGVSRIRLLVAGEFVSRDLARAAAPLLADLPMFQDRGAEVLKLVPFRRARIVDIARALKEQHDRLVSAGR